MSWSQPWLGPPPGALFAPPNMYGASYMGQPFAQPVAADSLRLAAQLLQLIGSALPVRPVMPAPQWLPPPTAPPPQQQHQQRQHTGQAGGMDVVPLAESPDSPQYSPTEYQFNLD